MQRNIITLTIVILTSLLLVSGCVASKSRMGMVQAEDGLMYGSAMSHQFIVDSSLFVNNKIKLRIRNTSGDPSFDLYGFQKQLEDAYRSLGYEPVTTNDFGILLDINVKYSGQVQEDMSEEFRFAGGALGGVGGAYDATREGQGLDAVAKGGAGIIVGATLGYIIGSYVTDDTYIIAADVSLGTVAPREDTDGTTIVFGKDEKIKRKKDNFRGFRKRETVSIVTYAGGRNVKQAEIVGGVRDRLFRILRDVI